MALVVPTLLRDVHQRDDEGRAWLDSIASRVGRAVERWDLVVDAPFDDGMAAWTAPATTGAGEDVVLKVSFPCRETRDEAAGLRVWQGAAAVELLDADEEDSALLLRRLRPGSTLRDERLPPKEHLAVGAELLRRMAAVPVPPGEPFEDLVTMAEGLGFIAAQRVERLLPSAPIPIDPGLCRHAIDLLQTLPRDAPRHGLLHGDFNPGNILLHLDGQNADGHPPAGWFAIDPEPVHGDLAWDPWPLLTQVGDDWMTDLADPADLAHRAQFVADHVGLDAGRCAAWCVARGVEHGLWAADRGWWTGFLGADGDFARSEAWATAATLLGD